MVTEGLFIFVGDANFRLEHTKHGERVLSRVARTALLVSARMFHYVEAGLLRFRSRRRQQHGVLCEITLQVETRVEECKARVQAPHCEQHVCDKPRNLRNQTRQISLQ